jgi:hypothetical protein
MANRFWVGGTGTWDAANTTNWSATSGGAGGASVPTAVDYATFNANSGGGTVTLGFDAPTQGLDIRAFTGTLDFSNYKITCAGNSLIILRQDAATTVTGTKQIELTYSGAVGTRTTGLGGVSETNTLNVKVIAGTDIFDSSTNANYNSLDFTGFAGSWTSRTIFVYGNLTISTGMTPSAGNGNVNFAATSGTQQITTNGKTCDFPVTINGVGGTVQLQDNLTMGSTRTFTLTAGTLDLVDKTLSTGIFSSSNSNIRSIAFGTGNITVTGNGATVYSGATATNLTVTGTPIVNATYAGATGTRNINGGGAANYSSSNPKIAFNITAGTDTVTLGGGNVYENVDFTGFTGSYGFTGTDPQLFGNLTLGTGMTGPSSATRSLLFNGASGTQTITSNGVTINSGIIIQGGSTCIFADALTQGATNTFVFSLGNIKLKDGATSTVGVFSTTGTTQKNLESTLAGTQATLSQASGTVDVNYLTIKDSNATGGATWNAFVDQSNIDAGNNDGWDFGISPVVGGAEYTYTIRSFTQPRRF